MSKLLTDDLVEKAARAMNETFPAFSWEQLSENGREVKLARARAALSSILPDIVEAIAKVAEGCDRKGRGEYYLGYGCAVEKIADAIRSLADKER